jgi:hypothetical protein
MGKMPMPRRNHLNDFPFSATTIWTTPVPDRGEFTLGADTVKIRPLNAGAAAGGKLAGDKTAPAPATGSSGLRIIKFFAAIALIPLCIGMTLGVHAHFMGAWSRMNYAVFGPGTMLNYFGAGAGVFALLAVLLWRPIVVYVFAHELTHAIAAWLCLGKVSNLTASAKGGQVTTSKTNTFIRLAPYCVPLYAIIVAVAYLALNQWWRPLDQYAIWLAFALGFFYCFHVGFTLWSLRRDQPDLKADGWLFSLVIVYLVNVMVFAVVFSFLQDNSGRDVWPTMRECSLAGWERASKIYSDIGQTIRQILKA